MDYKKAAAYWKEKDATSVKMSTNHLKSEIEKYILENNTCSLATGSGTFIRCTPIEYCYFEGAFWLFSEGGEKFIGLETNKNVCLTIYDKYGGFGNLKGMQIMGTVDLIEPFSKEYETAAQVKKIPLEALKKLPQPINLLKISPTRIDFLNSDFKKGGFSSRQQLVL